MAESEVSIELRTVNEGYCDGCAQYVWRVPVVMIDGDCGSIHLCPDCWTDFKERIAAIGPPEPTP